MTFEIGLSWPVTIPGAVPLTRKAVSVARVFVPKKPGTPTSQSLMTRVRPLWPDTELSWNTPARLAFGPPAAWGVVDSVTTRPGASGSPRRAVWGRGAGGVILVVHGFLHVRGGRLPAAMTSTLFSVRTGAHPPGFIVVTH